MRGVGGRQTHSAAEYWRLVGLEHESLLEQVLAADAEAWARPNRSLTEWLPRLKAAGFRTALLSNMPREQSRRLAPWDVNAAAALGLHALRYVGIKELRTELAAYFDGSVPLPVRDPALG